MRVQFVFCFIRLVILLERWEAWLDLESLNILLQEQSC